MMVITTLWLGLGGLILDIAPSPVPRSGISLGPVAVTEVSMDAEVVVITVYPDHADIHATFTMRNTGKKAETLEVGDPGAARPCNYTVSAKGVTVHSWQGTTLERFEAKVDGQPVKATCKQPPGTERAFEQEGVYFDWYLWSMTFETGKKHTVEVSYRIQTRDGNYTPEGILKRRRLAYILKTGKGWAGPIGSAEIIVRFADGLTPKHAHTLGPKGAKRTDREITWRFERFEPETDILIEYSVHRDAAAALASFEKALKKSPDNIGLLVDAAVAREELKRYLDAANTWKRLVDLAGEADRTASTPGPYTPADHHAARLYRMAGKTELARAVAAMGVQRLARFLQRIHKEGNAGWELRKIYRTNEENLRKLLVEMRTWAR